MPDPTPKPEPVVTFTFDELLHIRRLAKMGMKVKTHDLDLIARGKLTTKINGKKQRAKGSIHECGGEFFKKCSSDLFNKLRDIDPYTAKIERGQKEIEKKYYAENALKYRRKVIKRFCLSGQSHGLGIIEIDRQQLATVIAQRKSVRCVPTDMFHEAVIQEWKDRGLVEELPNPNRSSSFESKSIFRFKHFGEIGMDADQIENRLSAIQGELSDLKARTGEKMVRLSDGSSWEENAWRAAKLIHLERTILKFEQAFRLGKTI